MYFSDVTFDLVLYATPPITLYRAVRYVKKRDKAFCYLMLKDIFPQNALDLGMMTETGVKGLLYKYFRKKEKDLYAFSDFIGCMSPANAAYILKHNPQISEEKVGLCPNCIKLQDMGLSEQGRREMREKYGIPQDKKVFVYGGNLGKPQGIPFIIECLRVQMDNKDAYFLIVGDGTEYGKLEAFVNEEKPENMKLLKRLPKDDYDRMVAACDVGLIFLDHRFTIPNFPSRLLSYMQAGLPVLAATDPNTDIGKVIVEGGFGWWCESNDAKAFAARVKEALVADIDVMREKEIDFLLNNYTAEKGYAAIINKC
jgi:glycosyltransferase involved in cell wall biosynthesis